MTEENKTVELKDEDLENVNGGFSDTSYVQPQYGDNARVKVRFYKEGQLTYDFGVVTGITSSNTSVCGQYKKLWWVFVRRDGHGMAEKFAAGDVEPA